MWIDKIGIEKVALEFRGNIQGYGIKNIFALVSQKDIHLIRYPFGRDRILGFSTIFEGKKIIVSNSSEILSREIFTVAHEIGHIIYDFEDKNGDVKINLGMGDITENISEARAFYFANCFLMPEDGLKNFIRYELKKNNDELNALDIVRMQLEFQVSYSALLPRLHDLGVISNSHKSKLFDKRDEVTSRALFKKLDADEKLIKSSGVIEVPSSYLEYVTSNYKKEYIPYSSLEKALALLGMDSSIFKKEEEEKLNEATLDLDDIFEEFEN